MKNLAPLFLVLFLLAFLISCESDNVTPLPQLERYDASSMLTPTISGSIIPSDKDVELKYDNSNRITQRIGNLVYTFASTGYKYMVLDYVGDTVIYNGSEIIVKTQVLDDSKAQLDKEFKTVYTTQNGRIIKKEIGNDFYRFRDNDVTTYDYNFFGQLTHSFTIREDWNVESNYHYDNNRNLSSVINITTDKISNDTIYINSLSFSNYDSAPNLTKQLFIFDECFYRSLSANNFRQFDFVRTNDYGSVSTYSMQWDFLYDANNNPIY